jgi:hypothetical protein
VGTTHWADGATATGADGDETAGLTCEQNMVETYHVHTHVSFFLDGQQLSFPGQVGIVPLQAGGHCFYSIHTHDKSGKIHVEAPAPGTFTLGMLFQLWGQPLQGDNVAGLVNKPIVVYVTDAGVVTRAEGDWSTIELSSHREVTFQVGTPITEIQNYTWAAN